MFFFIQAGLSILGMVILMRGRLRLGRHELPSSFATLIGLVLAAVLPLGLGFRFVSAVSDMSSHALTHGRPPNTLATRVGPWVGPVVTTLLVAAAGGVGVPRDSGGIPQTRFGGSRSRGGKFKPEQHAAPTDPRNGPRGRKSRSLNWLMDCIAPCAHTPPFRGHPAVITPGRRPSRAIWRGAPDGPTPLSCPEDTIARPPSRPGTWEGIAG
jgi:hypothetical protein